MIEVEKLEPDYALIERFLSEDIGTGDLTSKTIEEHVQAKAQIVTRVAMVLCGKDWFNAVFERISPKIKIDWFFDECAEIDGGKEICSLTGPARALLTGERTALNLLQTLSATATLSKRYARAVEGTGAIVLDTRKTIPGLRLAQKYAVRCGGCCNHRFGLYDGILIKENHIASAGSIKEALTRAYQLDSGVIVEIEVETLAQLREALHEGANRILLDNFSLEEMTEAVSIAKGTNAELEASGNVTLDRIQAIAATGVHYISVGELTKNVSAIDLSMRIDIH